MPMDNQNKRQRMLLRALGAVADAERAGRVVTHRDIAAAAGLSDQHGPGLRRSLMDMGWLETIRCAGGGHSTHSAVTAKGWAQLGGRPSRGARKRPCLGCGCEFHSEGAHHRLCDDCRGGEAWRCGGGESYRLALP